MGSIVRLTVFSFAVLMFAGLASAGFYVMEDGERRKIAPAEQAEEKAAQQSTITQSTEDNSDFVDLSGDTLQGPLNLNGFGISNLASPDDPSDAVTKAYVDGIEPSTEGDLATEDFVLNAVSNVSSNGDIDLSGYATEDYVDSRLSDSDSQDSSQGLPGVLDNNRSADSPLVFPNGLMFGRDSSASDDSMALGVNSSASGSNSIAFGTGSLVEGDDTARFGSSKRKMDVTVSGDLDVEGSLDAELNQEYVWSYSFAVDRNGTEVSVPEEVSGSYSVSVTPVGSMTDVGVFNKSESDFIVKSSEFTRVDVQIAKLT